MELVHPSVKYKESFIEAVKEFRSAANKNVRSRRYREISFPELKKDFATYIGKLRGAEKGEGLPDGYVPHTEFWLVDGSRYLGSIRIRHRLTDHLLNVGGHIGYDIRPLMRGQGYGTMQLRLALPKAKELGISRVLITCDEKNIASQKIIESAGGVFEDTRQDSEGNTKRRYWIDL